MSMFRTSAKLKRDKPSTSNGPTNETTSEGRVGSPSLEPDEIAGLREHKRQYTKELQVVRTQSIKQKKLDIDPNRAYPTLERSTTLFLSELL
jgi:hypothetical protein